MWKDTDIVIHENASTPIDSDISPVFVYSFLVSVEIRKPVPRDKKEIPQRVELSDCTAT